MFTYFLKGGFLMWPIFLLSVLGLAVVLEKLWLIYKVSNEINFFKKNLNNFRKSLKIFANQNNFIYRVISSILQKNMFQKREIKEVIEISLEKESRNLEKHLDWLATISSTAPLLGFLGTVSGMVKAFQVIEKTGESVNPSLLAGGIWEALITTIFGLSVAIPCVFAYNYLTRKIESKIFESQILINEFLENHYAQISN